MNKRGVFEEKVWLFIFYFLLAIMILVIVLNFISKLQKDVIYKQQFSVIDIAFLKDLIVASPYDIEVSYTPRNNYNFNFKVNPCIILVSSTKEEITASQHDCISTDVAAEETLLKDVLKINFKKEKNSLVIT